MSKNSSLLVGAILAGLMVGYAAPRVHMKMQVRHQLGDYAAYFPAADVRAIVYGTQDCSFCRQTREYLNKKGVRYVFADVQNSAEAAAQHAKLGGGPVPATLIGNRRVQGFWIEELDDALGASNSGH
ncbi:glutaredoxin family protein [Roseateles sp.]|uniref:glutaredoxin family protein n=1 Tax=Roseateles sp. TaxID=1971397 RepID=UPI003BAC8755